MPWLCPVPESQQGQDSPGAAQSLLSAARAGLAAAQGIKDGKLQRHFMGVSEMAGRIHTCPSHPLQKLSVPGKHQLTEIRPERDKVSEIKSLATKQMWLLHREPALGPNNSLRKGLQAKGNLHPGGILPAEVSRGFDTFPWFQRGTCPT